MNAKLVISWIGAAMIGGATVAALGGAARPADEMTARKLTIVDENGQSRIVLEIVDGEAGLTIRGKTGQERINLTEFGGHAGLVISDTAGRETVRLASHPDGGAMFAFPDPADGEKMRASFAISAKGWPMISLRDIKDRTRLRMSVVAGGPVIAFTDDQGKTTTPVFLKPSALDRKP